MPYKDKDKQNQYANTYIAIRRAAWITEQGNQCKQCNATGVPFDIDHIDRAKKQYRIASLWTRTKAVRDTELAKCQVLCKQCHKAKTKREQYITNPEHGTRTMYVSRGCRCDQCRAYNSNRVQQQRAKAKANGC